MFRINNIYKIFILFILFNSIDVLSQTNAGGKITQDDFWTADKSPYIVTSDITITAGTTLYIQSGVEVLLNRNCNFKVQGNLVANGTSENTIIFSANTTNPKAPFWGSISIERTSIVVMNHCRIEYSGAGSHGPIILNNLAIPTLTSITLASNKYNGVELTAGKYQLNSTIQYCDLPYFTLGTIEIEKTYSLIIQPGVTFKFAPNCDLKIYGSLISRGKKDSLITFTSLKDDDADGFDTGGDGYTTGRASDWGGVYLNDITSPTQSAFEYTSFKFGGSTSPLLNSLLCLDKTSPKIELCRFENSGGMCITCINNSVPDCGGGQLSSIGFNTFVGCSAQKYAIFNRSSAAIYARNNCWGQYDSTSINKILYDNHLVSAYGKVLFMPFSIECNPSALLPPELIFPTNYSIGIPISPKLIWHSSVYASLYSLQISTDTAFSKNINELKNTSDTTAQLSNLKYNTQYFIRLQSSNWIGESLWSRVFQFTTYDTSKPSIPVLIYPANMDTSTPRLQIFIRWQSDQKTDYCQIQLSEDSLFSDLIINDSLNNKNQEVINKLNPVEYYYWRVSAHNANGWSGWSPVSCFKTLPYSSIILPPPQNWQYSKQTGENSVIVVQKSIRVQNNSFNLKIGDAIGAFYLDNDSLRCGGYAVADSNNLVVMTVWGDNTQTPDNKDGFSNQEKFKFQIWDSRDGDQIPVEPAIESGIDYFVPDTISIMSGFSQLDSIRIPVEAGCWTLVSSNIDPFLPDFKLLLPNSIT